MAHHPFIEEPLQESKNISLGDKAEQWFSRRSRKDSYTLFISPLVSRTLGIKQIDAAEITRQGAILWEVKSFLSQEELAIRRAFTHKEQKKWRKTRIILSDLLQLKMTVRIVVIKYQNGFNFVKNLKLV